MNKEETKQQLKDIEELMIHVDKPHRIEALHAIHKQVEPLNFWTVFHRWWNTIENPSDYIDHINDMFEYDEWGYNFDMLQDQSQYLSIFGLCFIDGGILLRIQATI